MSLDLTRALTSTTPFTHFRAANALDADLADAALEWLRYRAIWRLRIENFYEQHELSLLDQRPSGPAGALISAAFLAEVRAAVEDKLDASLELVGVCAHRLTAGQTIRIHNDHIGETETHRLLLQLNEGWDAKRGGLLMLFGDDQPESLTDVVMPDHRSVFAFEISARSHHAVSTIRSGERFTVVYTFRRAAQ